MTRDNYNKCFKVLELSPDASLPEIQRAYLFLKDLYSKNSIVTIPVEDDVPEGHKEQVLHQIEEAYRTLLTFFKEEAAKSKPAKKPLLPEDDFQIDIPEPISYSGHSLKQIRKNLNIDLLDIAITTKIQVEHLENIENEKYNDLPPEVY
ncbi:MAG: helix-turn-helix domain-containing protein [Deltaproteobacteria bacterium]|nr:helix-turn-helix domain-containing protein [Deltaproteobacteria bacterium]